jgi:hypothetical protein
VLHRLVGAADHQAVAVLQPPDAAARAGVAEVDALLRELLGANARVLPVGVAAVDDDVALRQAACELVDDRIGHLRRDHHPRDARPLQLAHGIGRALGEDRALGGELARDVEVTVDREHLVAALEEAQRHVVAHLAQTDHREAHGQES